MRQSCGDGVPGMIMNSLIYILKYGWVIFLPICLISYIPLALQVEETGGIPAWAYWMGALFFTTSFLVWLAIGCLYYVMQKKIEQQGQLNQ
jgi:hypothetical protein